jgi:hypothetical protein
MEDVIDVMEGLITKVVEVESGRDRPRCVVESPDSINVNSVMNMDDDVEVIILDDTLHKPFESPSEVYVQVDPLSIDTENVAVKKEPVSDLADCKELVVHELYTEANLDDIDLAMEVVEEIVVEEVMIDDELDQTSNSDHKENVIRDECEEQITEFKISETCTDIRDVVGGTKVEANDDKCPQLSDTKMETAAYNGNGEDVDDECEDDVDDGDDDEYDGDNDDDDEDEDDDDDEDEEEEAEEEGRKDVKRDDLHGGSDMKLENKTTKLPKQQPETRNMGSVMPEMSVNRRSSQESTTTTTTTTETSTANSSSSSSGSEGDSSSSNEDSSKSSSNSDSDNASGSNSEEADTVARATSAALTDKKTHHVPSAAKREDLKKQHSDGTDKQDGNYGMYVCCVMGLA